MVVLSSMIKVCVAIIEAVSRRTKLVRVNKIFNGIRIVITNLSRFEQSQVI